MDQDLLAAFEPRDQRAATAVAREVGELARGAHGS
jgi:hypothetical protein